MNLELNFAPVTLSGKTIVDIGSRPYSEHVLKELRQKNSETHVFKRDGKNNIIDIPITRDAVPLSSKTMEVDLAKEKRFLAPLLNAALVRAFHGKRDILRDYPVQILGSSQRNYIQSKKLPNWVQKRSLIEFSPRNLYDQNGKSFFGVLCDVRLRNLLLGSCAELIRHGISVEGRYVLIDEESYDLRILPRPMLIGRVAQIKGEILVLEDNREEYRTVEASRARLSGNYVDFECCVKGILGKQDAQIVLDDSQERAAILHSGPGRLEMIKKTLDFLRKSSLEAIPGACLHVGELLNQKDEGFPIIEKIKKPSLVFDPSGTRTDVWNERGIKKNGPYDQRTFTPKRLNIAVICQASYEGQVDAFAAKFLEGMPDILTGPKGRQQARYGDGFLRRFNLEKANVQNFTAVSPALPAYEAACNKALSDAVNEGFKWDLALVQVEEKFKSLPEKINPYYGSKSILLKNHVAVQSFRLETMKQLNSNLVFSMNQMSLASYAKLGGRPWLLSAEQTVGHELVIGIGSHMASTSRIGGGRRHVGITTVFSSDGSYHLSERTNVVPFEEYSTALTETLKRTITRVRDEDNWKNTDRVRLIFHMFKPAKDIESEAIKEAVEGLELKNVTYAFLHIATQHPFVIFDLEQKGEPYWTEEKKGVLGPIRGVHLKLGDLESLVVFSGVSELKKVSHGLPRPCLLKLHRNSTFRDMTYLARQAFDFTAHSWRIMSPESFPITIKYSDSIAERLTGLKHIDGWDDDAIKFRDIGRTPWFL